MANIRDMFKLHNLDLLWICCIVGGNNLQQVIHTADGPGFVNLFGVGLGWIGPVSLTGQATAENTGLTTQPLCRLVRHVITK